MPPGTQEFSSRMIKKILKTAIACRCISFLLAVYVRFFQLTSRWNFEGLENLSPALSGGKGAIFLFQHARIIMAPAICSKIGHRMLMLVSAHRDGEMIADAIKGYGIGFIRGSTDNPRKREKKRDGTGAAMLIAQALEQGAVVGITPDGPRGPAGTVHPGIVRIAQITGAPVVPAGCSASRGIRLSSWDRFFLAGPFSRCHYVLGTPVYVSSRKSQTDLENSHRQIEDALAHVTGRADILAGRQPDVSDSVSRVRKNRESP